VFSFDNNFTYAFFSITLFKIIGFIDVLILKLWDAGSSSHWETHFREAILCCGSIACAINVDAWARSSNRKIL